jgi:hypothetical protein
MAVAKRMRELPQVECPLEHFFSEGIYVRQILMPAGAYVVGKKHKTTHLNVIIAGSVDILLDGGGSETLTAPFTFESVAGVQKALFIRETCIWQTVHLNPENITDIPTLEDLLVISDELECAESKELT